MTDNSKNSLHTTTSNSTSSFHNKDNISPYILLASSDPTKIKLKRFPSTNTASSSSTDNSLYGAPPPFVDGKTKTVQQTSNSFPMAMPASANSNNQISVPSSSTAGNSSTSGTNHNFLWHTPYPPPPLTTNSSTNSSTATSAYSSTITSQTPHWSNSYQNMNSATGTGQSFGSQSSYNGIPFYPVPIATISSNSSAHLNSISSNLGSVNNPFSGMLQKTYIGNNNQQSGIPAMAVPKSVPLSSPLKRGRRKQAEVKVKLPSKKPRGRPKKAAPVHQVTPPPSLKLSFNNMVPILNYSNTHAAATTSSSSANPTSMALPHSAQSKSLYTIYQMLGDTSNAPTSFSGPLTNTEVTTITPPSVTANVPMPPNWLEHSEDTIMSLFTFKKYNVSSTSAEYQTIANMLHPVQVKGIEQIVNPDLWKRFVNTRKEMLRSKTDDLNILTKLGLDEREVMRCAHFTLNYAKDPLLTPYSCNMALLFHCTRNQSNLNNILSQGLDERLSNVSGGLLGKGIYFADDPKKSMQYDNGSGCILIFAVLLGDCISVDHFSNKSALVREPEKVKQQKRNFNDQFFDSIVARPAGYNEYVIYNRYQCCPLYQIEYIRSIPPMQYQSNFNYAAQSLPPIAWIPEGPNYAMPIQKMVTQWPFYAVDLFEKMGVAPPKDFEDDGDFENEIAPFTPTDTPLMSVDDKLNMLTNLGFYDEDKNKEILLRFHFDLEQTVNYLLDNGNGSDAMIDPNQPSTSAAASLSSNNFTSSTDALPSTSNASTTHSSSSSSKSTVSKKLIETIDLIGDDSACSDVEVITENDLKPSKGEFNSVDLVPMDLPDEIAEWALEFDTDFIKKEVKVDPALSPAPLKLEECPICCNEYDSFEKSPSLWKELKCSHKLCLGCYSSILTTRTTISGVQHTFLKCPFCQGITGIEIGTCPDVQMNVSIVPYSCESYEPTDSIKINYFCHSDYHLNRTAYLPNNSQGQEVLNLLRTAWDRRLCFTIGTSVTTGQENVVVWNIHHKTSLRGGTSNYGYPDPSYIERVKWELKAYGIE